jgi:23S rRNA (uracil1939-C5)-methyltransferase
MARDRAPQGFLVLEGTVEEELGSLLPADILLLNPPRAGLDPRVPSVLEGGGVPRLIYISCDPATLARDLRRLGGAYQVTSVRAFDLFPQTAHVETVVTMETTES